jgi:hypothetical protein
MTKRRDRRRKGLKEMEHWSFSATAEYHLHDAEHCKHWYGNVWCFRHAQR